MRSVLVLALFGCLLANAQKPPATGAPGAPGVPGVPAMRWRQTFGSFLNRPPGSLNARDLQQMESELALAGQYCAGLTPGDYEANRALVRQMMTYLGTVQVAGDQEMNTSLRRLRGSLGAFPCAYALPPGQQAPAAAPPAPIALGEPPFSMSAPTLQNVAKADQETAKDLRERYDIAASHAATAWKNAEVIRQGLIAKGMSLNAQTAASVDHLKLFLNQAADALREHKWDDALSSLQAVEAATQKVNKAVGN